ncbi:hypothetical protein EVAR_45243_1 [Eumeta japonica]|uniref:Uncharacterized protein n=1 Tax=Eumeta variegata TaxID=151549 RepID=A0A4C1XG90_EUMVA|nr:hypothetical protein EVAR_45243_1 [Eumeta japonica]
MSRTGVKIDSEKLTSRTGPKSESTAKLTRTGPGQNQQREKLTSRTGPGSESTAREIDIRAGPGYPYGVHQHLYLPHSTYSNSPHAQLVAVGRRPRAGPTCPSPNERTKEIHNFMKTVPEPVLRNEFNHFPLSDLARGRKLNTNRQCAAAARPTLKTAVSEKRH